MTTLWHLIESPFAGVRITLHTDKKFELAEQAMYDNVGKIPICPNEVAEQNGTWAEYEAAMRSHVGPGGFMLFSVIDHGAWVSKAGVNQKSIRFIVGNPMIAITMIRHDLAAGLFAPVELLLSESDRGGCDLMYVKPSSLIVITKNDALSKAAEILDAKLQNLASLVVG